MYLTIWGGGGGVATRNTGPYIYIYIYIYLLMCATLPPPQQKSTMLLVSMVCAMVSAFFALWLKDFILGHFEGSELPNGEVSKAQHRHLKDADLPDSRFQVIQTGNFKASKVQTPKSMSKQHSRL